MTYRVPCNVNRCTVQSLKKPSLTLPGLAPTPGRISGPSERSEPPGRRSPGGGSREGGRGKKNQKKNGLRLDDVIGNHLKRSLVTSKRQKIPRHLRTAK
eukprot:1184330-Prorocentrum_minimum.AAC.5